MPWIEPKKNWLNKPVLKNPPIDVVEDASDIVPCVVYHKLLCPLCGTDKSQVYKTSVPVRYHRCGTGHRFKSVEKT